MGKRHHAYTRQTEKGSIWIVRIVLSVALVLSGLIYPASAIIFVRSSDEPMPITPEGIAFDFEDACFELDGIELTIHSISIENNHAPDYLMRLDYSLKNTGKAQRNVIFSSTDTY